MASTPNFQSGRQSQVSTYPQQPLRTASAMSSSSRTSLESGSAVLSTTTAVKCEVMIQYLRQRQIEKLWTDGNANEGVVLKRAKNDFVSQPPELAQQVFGFFDEVRKLNVKVNYIVMLCVCHSLISVGGNDCQDSCGSNILERVQSSVCTTQQRSPASDPAQHWQLVPLQEAPLRSFHQRCWHACSLGRSSSRHRSPR